MAFAFGFLLFLVGFVMLFAGIGLLIGGEIKFKSGKKIPKRSGRHAAIAFLSFFPLVVVAYLILQFADPGPEEERMVPRPAVHWPLALVCLGLGAFFVRRGMRPKQPRRSTTPTLATSSFNAVEPMAPTTGPAPMEFEMPANPAPAPGPAMGKPARPRQSEANPFDFN